MAAATVEVNSTSNVLDGIIVTGQITGHASGSAGGDTVAPSDLGMRSLDTLIIGPVVTIDKSCRWIPASKKVEWYLEDSAGVEVAIAGNASTYTAQYVAYGKA